MKNRIYLCYDIYYYNALIASVRLLVSNLNELRNPDSRCDEAIDFLIEENPQYTKDGLIAHYKGDITEEQK
jgi:hypothetical protein